MTEALCAWVARPLAWALPPEPAGTADLALAGRAIAELVAVSALSRLLAAGELPFAAEAALRAAASRPLSLDGWLMVLDTLEQLSPAPTDWPAPLPPETLAACEALGTDATPHAFLRALGAPSLPATVGPGLAAIAAAMPVLATLCHAEAVVPGTPHWRVRRFVGTGHPTLRETEAVLPDHDDTLCFWDGAGTPRPVPHWLAHWDPESRDLKLFAGRHATTGRPLYRTWRGPEPQEAAALPGDAPAFLMDIGWHTPPPAPRLAQELGQMPADPGSETHRMATERVAVPLSTPPPSVLEGARLIVRVLTGRYMLRHAALRQDQPVVIGRNHQFATLVLHHHQISRAHTKVRLDALGNVWVSDMGSTNGSQVNGRDIGTDEVRCDPGDVIGAGPLLLRVEYATGDEEARLRTITSLAPGDDRDPLTRLLHPRCLAEQLPPTLHDAFRDGGVVPPGAPSLWGVLVSIDRLTALHAQHGEQVADATFAVAARVMQYHAPDPLSVVKVAYGEVLIPVLGVDEAGARAEAQRLIDALQDHPWEPPVRRLTMTAAIGDKKPEEAAAVWLARIRKALQDGRTRQRGTVI